MKVLVADDSLLIRRRLVDLIAPCVKIEHIFETEEVPGTIRHIAKFHPDIVVLDLEMPGGSGLDVLEAVATISQKPLIIVLTNYGEPTVREYCLKMGADYFLDKSREFEQIVNIVEAHRTSMRDPH